MNALKPLMTSLMALNWLAAPIAIVWLVILGEWWAIGVAFASLFSHFLLGLALIPGLALVAPAVAAGESRPRLVLFLGALPLLYTAALVTVWCIGVLILLLRRAEASSLIPICLLAYSIGTAPWGYMASKEVQSGGGEGSMIATFFAQVGLAIAIAYLLIAEPASPRPLWWIMGTVMVLEVLFSLFVAHVTMRAPRRQVDSWPE